MCIRPLVPIHLPVMPFCFWLFMAPHIQKPLLAPQACFDICCSRSSIGKTQRSILIENIRILLKHNAFKSLWTNRSIRSSIWLNHPYPYKNLITLTTASGQSFWPLPRLTVVPQHPPLLLAWFGDSLSYLTKGHLGILIKAVWVRPEVLPSYQALMMLKPNFEQRWPNAPNVDLLWRCCFLSARGYTIKGWPQNLSWITLTHYANPLTCKISAIPPATFCFLIL